MRSQYENKQAVQGDGSVSLLPGLQTNKHLPDASIGDFVGIDLGLKIIRDALADGHSPTVHDLHSLPDTFGHPTLFEIVMKDTGHILYPVFQTQWRDLLIMILQYRELGLDIRAEQIALADLEDGHPLLLHVAGEFLPEAYNGSLCIYTCLAEDNTYTPIAVQSAEFLVCPVNDIKKPLKKMPAFVTTDTRSHNCVNGVLAFGDCAQFLQDNPERGVQLRDQLNSVLKNTGNTYLRSELQGLLELVKDLQDPSGYHDSTESLIPQLRGVLARHEQPITFNGKHFVSKNIFNTKICVFSDADQLQGGFSSQQIRGWKPEGKQRYALFPFQEEFLKAYVADAANSDELQDKLVDLATAITMQMDNETIQVILQFEHSQPYGNSYRLSDCIGDPTQLAPPLTVWPNKVDPMGIWNSYHVFHAKSIRHTMSSLSLRVLNWQDSCQPVEALAYSENRENFSVSISKSFPYILYGNVSENGQDPMAAGALLLRPTGRLPARRYRMGYVALDIGTTNTLAYYAVSSDEADMLVPNPVQFMENTGLSVIEDPSNMFNVAIHKYFLPLNVLYNTTGIFPSLLCVRKPKNKNASQDTFPLAEGNIAFLDPAGTSMDISQLETDIKWDKRIEAKKNMEIFIAELALLCAWKLAEEEAGQIDWRAAYPTAFDEDRLTTYKKAMASVLNTVSMLTGFGEVSLRDTTSSADPDAGNLQFTTENHAGGLALGQQGNAIVDPKIGHINIDIGGGSTDFSIWQYRESIRRSDQAIIETSLPFAGNMILADTIYRYVQSGDAKDESEMLVKIFDECLKLESDKLEWDVVRKDLRKFRTRVNLLLAAIGDAENPVYRYFDDEYVGRLVSVIEFNLAMLVAYAAYLLNYTQKHNDDYPFQIRENQVQIILLGNGSKLLDWTRPTFQTQILPKVFECGLEMGESKKAAGNDPVQDAGSEVDDGGKQKSPLQITVGRSYWPKEEVGRGLSGTRRLFYGQTKPCEDYIHTKAMSLVSGDGVHDQTLETELVQIFINGIEPLLNDSKCRALFSHWKFDINLIKTFLQMQVNNFHTSTFNRGFAVLMEALNAKFFEKKSR